MKGNVFYFDQLNVIGGIETFFYYLGKKYGKDHDITLYYRNGNNEQVKRLSQYIRVRRYYGDQVIRCKRAFLCFGLEIIDNIIAEEYYQVLHGDYTALKIYPKEHPKIQKRIAVSHVVSDSYREAKGFESEVCYNPYVPEKPRKVLNLVSATRLTPEKGWPRMEFLADALEKAGIPFIWMVYTDADKKPANKNIILRPTRLDILDYIANADYFVQLSDAEGYCYSVVEALSVGTPVIVTDFKVSGEIGVVNGKNGFILPMDMSEIPIDAIYKGLRKFKYTPLEDNWGEYLAEGEADYQADMNRIVKVSCLKIYFDLQIGRQMEYGEVWECTMLRAEELMNLGLVRIIEE